MPRKQGCYSPIPLLDINALIAQLQALGCCNGGPITPALGLANGLLTLTIGGQSTAINLRGTLAVDLADTPLGYWLPLS